MEQRRQHSKRQDEKKAPPIAELRRATWSSIEQIVAMPMNCDIPNSLNGVPLCHSSDAPIFNPTGPVYEAMTFKP